MHGMVNSQNKFSPEVYNICCISCNCKRISVATFKMKSCQVSFSIWDPDGCMRAIIVGSSNVFRDPGLVEPWGKWCWICGHTCAFVFLQHLYVYSTIYTMHNWRVCVRGHKTVIGLYASVRVCDTSRGLCVCVWHWHYYTYTEHCQRSDTVVLRKSMVTLQYKVSVYVYTIYVYARWMQTWLLYYPLSLLGCCLCVSCVCVCVCVHAQAVARKTPGHWPLAVVTCLAFLQRTQVVVYTRKTTKRIVIKTRHVGSCVCVCLKLSPFCLIPYHSDGIVFGCNQKTTLWLFANGIFSRN